MKAPKISAAIFRLITLHIDNEYLQLLDKTIEEQTIIDSIQIDSIQERLAKIGEFKRSLEGYLQTLHAQGVIDKHCPSLFSTYAGPHTNEIKRPLALYFQRRIQTILPEIKFPEPTMPFIATDTIRAFSAMQFGMVFSKVLSCKISTYG